MDYFNLAKDICYSHILVDCPVCGKFKVKYNTICRSCEHDVNEVIEYEPEEKCQFPGCPQELIEEWELEQGLCTGHIQYYDEIDLEARRHPDE